MCLNVWFLGSNFFGTLRFLDFLEAYFLHQIGEVFLHYFFKYVFNFLLFFSFWHPYESDVRMFKVVLEVRQPLFIFFWILVSSFCSGWMFISSFWSKLLIRVPISFPSLLVTYTFSFISLFIAFTFSSILQPYSTNSVSILITSVLTCASDSCLSLHHLVVFFL